MRDWMLANGIANEAELATIEKEAAADMNAARRAAWEAYRAPLDTERKEVLALLDELAAVAGTAAQAVQQHRDALAKAADAGRKEICEAARRSLRAARMANTQPAHAALAAWLEDSDRDNHQRYTAPCTAIAPLRGTTSKPCPHNMRTMPKR